MTNNYPRKTLNMQEYHTKDDHPGDEHYFPNTNTKCALRWGRHASSANEFQEPNDPTPLPPTSIL